jgi:membrane associated rhomboid family serine protease
VAVIGASVARFLWVLYRGGVPSPGWAINGPLVRDGEWWRVFAYAIEHGGAFHILMNMFVVYSLGFALERMLGTWRFAIISIVGCLGSAAFALFLAFNYSTVGASGMILSWAGALLPIANRAGRQSLLVWLVQIAVISLIPGVSWQGHLGGFVFGLLCGLALRAGPRAFPYLVPLLLFLAGAAVVVAAHPERFAM